MPRRLTTEQFIAKARAIHGDRYGYSQVEYANAHTKVMINCHIHGLFQQSPTSHLSGSGCPECGTLAGHKAQRKTAEEFIKEARAIHGDRYDYSRVEYVSAHTKVTIVCPDHGPFQQVPASHLYQATDCPECTGTERLTTESFIDKAREVHGDRYDYSQVEYVRYHDPVTIVCSDHGIFDQRSSDHLGGKGCPHCGNLAIAQKLRLTRAEFIEKAKEVYGERYDYSQVEYVDGKTKVTIICREHGPFSQEATSHLSKHGCPNCAGNKKRTTEAFIEEAKAIHGDRYDYSQVEYVNTHNKVTIVCSDHGPFQQAPVSHLLQAAGCAECAGLAPLTTEKFIEKAKAVHGDQFDYSLVEYVNQSTNVTIICPDHGPFQQAPGGHIYAQSGCAECSGVAPLTTEKFIEKAKAIHGDRYDYSQVQCEGGKRNVTIICPEHGPFRQLPTNHYRGKGCPDCGGSKPHTTKSFIEAAQAVHGDRYDYSQVEYVNNKTTVKIVCPDHGPFMQGAKVHILGSGCPGCSDQGFNPSEPAILYYLAITTGDGDIRYKIGITNRTVEDRFRSTDLARIRIVKTWRFSVGRVAAEREAEILYQYAGERYYGPDILVGGGNTELFTHDVLGVDRRDGEHGQPTVDEDANLTSRQIQSDFDL